MEPAVDDAAAKGIAGRLAKGNHHGRTVVVETAWSRVVETVEKQTCCMNGCYFECGAREHALWGAHRRVTPH